MKTSKKLLSLLLAALIVICLAPTVAVAAVANEANPEVWDTLKITKNDGTDAVENTDYTKTLINDYSTSEGFLQVYQYTLKSDNLTLSGGGSYVYSSSRTEKAIVELDSSLDNANVTLNNVTALKNVTVPTGKNAKFTLVGDNYIDEIIGEDESGQSTVPTLTFGGNGSLIGNRIGGVSKYGTSTLCPHIVINSGTYTLKGGHKGSSAPDNKAAAIGGGQYCSVDGITINGGTISAKSDYGAVIGGGQEGNAKNITINGGTIYAKGSYGAAIGGGQNGIGEDITINGGTLVLTVSRGGVGGGQNADGKNIKITGGDITIIDGAGGGALIGGGQDANASGINITGGKLRLETKHQSGNKEYWNVGIGAGSNSAKANTTADRITISNADISIKINPTTASMQNKGYGYAVGTPNANTDATNVSMNCGVYNGNKLPDAYHASGYSSYMLSNYTYAIGKTDTVTVEDGKITGGIFAFDIAEYVSYTCTVTEKDGEWTVSPINIVIEGGEKDTKVIVEQNTEVDKEEVAKVVQDDDTRKAIADNTEVKGVKLTTTAEAGKISGLQAVINEAIKDNSDLEEAIKTAETVNIEVNVSVIPTEYKKPVKATQDTQEQVGTVKFELKPTATVTVGTGEDAKSETVDVANDMIDTTKPITVHFYTGFKPAKVIHTGDDGFEEVFRTTGDKTFTYNEITGVCTLTISHFSELTAVSEDYVAKITNGEKIKNYKTLQEAIADATTGDTITLLSNIADAGTVSLPEGVTLNGDKKKITGSSAVYINAGGGAVKNVVFENIHNSSGKQSAIYAYSLKGSAFVTDCTFDNVDWDAIQTTPIAGATVTITDNIFKHTAEGKAHRYIHVQSDKNVDFTATVTGNRFYNCAKLEETGLEVYYPANADKLNCSGNYMDAPMGVCIGTGNSFNNAYAKAFPFRNEEFATDVIIAITCFKENDNTYFYPTEKDAIEAGIVAKIDKMGYKSLAEAIAAVTDSTATTITMLADVNDAHGISVPSGRNITVDFKDHKYTINHPGAGSTGTSTQGFQLLKDSTIEFKNGTINVARENKDYTWTSDPRGIAWVINNYANLKLTNMIVDGTNVAKNLKPNGLSDPGIIRYVINSNTDTVTVNGGSIVAAEGDVAIGSNWYGSDYPTHPTVNITGTEIDGKVEAIAGTVYLETGTTVNGQVRVGENKNGSETGALVNINAGATINNAGKYAVVVFGQNTTNIKGTVNGIIGTNGKAYNAGSVININDGAKVTQNNDVAIYMPNGTLNISGGTITGATAVYFKSTSLNITGGELIGNGNKADYVYDGNGCNATGDALVIDSCNYPNGISEVAVTGGLFKSTNGAAVAAFTKDNTCTPVTKFITGGTFSSVPDATYVADGYSIFKMNRTPVVYVVSESAPAHSTYMNTWTYNDDLRLYEESYVAPQPSNPEPEKDDIEKLPIVVDLGTTIDVSKDVEVKKDESGVVAAKTELSEKVAEELVEVATENKSTEVIIAAAAVTTEIVNKAEVAIPVKAIEELSKVDTVQTIVIQTNVAEIALDKETAKEIAAQSPDGAIITVEAVRQDEESEKVAQDVYELKIIASTASGQQIISDFKGGKVTVKVATPEGLTGKKIACLYRSDKGVLTRRTVTTQNDVQGWFSFTTNHFSDYIVTEESVAQKMLVNQTALTQNKAKAYKGRKVKLSFKRAKWDKELGKKTKTYQIYRSTKKNSGFKRIKTLTSTKSTVTYTNKNLKKGKTYYYKVRAKVKLSNGKYAYTKWSKVQKVKAK